MKILNLKFTILKKEEGQSLVELLVAIGIFSIATAAGFSLFFGGQIISTDSSNINLATDYVREAQDALRAIRNRNFTELLTDGPHGFTFNGSEWLLSSSTSDTKDVFTRQVNIAKGDSDNIKIATTTVTWSSADPSRTESLTFVEQFTDWETPLQSSCKSQALTGDWTNPVTLGSADIGSGNSGTDVVAKGSYAYVSGTASSASKPDIFVFDVSAPAAPVQKASLNVTNGGINALFLNGNYLYAASPDNSKEFLVFDVTTPTSITLKGSLDLTGNDDALSVVTIGTTAIVGRQGSAAKQISFIDVSDPANPSVIKEFTSPNGGDITDLAYTDNRLYATNYLANGTADILTFDITDPRNPTYISSYDVPATDKPLSAYVEIKAGGTNLLLGDGDNELVAVGATTTSGMYVRSRVNVGGKVNDTVCVLGNLAFLATDNQNAEFTVVNVNNLNSLSVYSTLNYPNFATGIDFDSNKVYMAVRSNDALRIITSQ